MNERDAQAMLDALTAQTPMPDGHHWRVQPHPQLPGWFWAGPVDAASYPSPDGVLLVGPNGRRLSMPSSPGLGGATKEAVAVLRELADSDLSDDELKSEILSREAAAGHNPHT